MMIQFAGEAVQAVQVVHQLVQLVPGDVPNPGGGTAPPGSGGIVKILQWAAWLATAACVVGLLAAGAGMALAHSGHGRGGSEHAAKLGWVCGGCVVIGSASAIVGALL